MTYGPDEDRLPLTRLGIGDHLDDHRTDYRERQYQEVKATIVATLRDTNAPTTRSARRR